MTDDGRSPTVPGTGGGTRVMGMFPLGTVLLPYMPLPLRVFEPRYKTLMADIAQAENPEFGVVLIERGHEVGGGDARFDVGTVARVVRVGGGMGVLAVTAVGGRRIAVEQWLGDAPYPRALVRDLPDLAWDADHADLPNELALAELEVRAALDLAAEVGQPAWPATVEVADDPAVALWQLAAVAPLGPMDHLELLGAATAQELLGELRAAVAAVTATLALRRRDE